ncbi:MAG: hypothetical protein GMKNLPBB_02282 [Myxococcota bacterium]|nr:hypothetical protein [Myxococcota bacterium]
MNGWRRKIRAWAAWAGMAAVLIAFPVFLHGAAAADGDAEAGSSAGSVEAASPDRTPASRTGTGVPGYTLEAAIRDAHRTSLPVEIARWEKAKWEGKEKEARWANWWPMMRLDAFFTFPVPEIALADRNDISSLTPGSQFGTFRLGDWGYLARARFEAAWPIYTFGKLQGAQDAAEAAAEAAGHYVDVVRLKVSLDVVQAYIGALAAHEGVGMAGDVAESLDSALGEIRESLDRGEDEYTDQDLFQLEYYRSQIETRRIQAVQDRAVAMRALRWLTGRETLEADQLDPRPFDQLPESLLTPLRYAGLAARSRPEIRALAAAARARKHLLEVQKAFRYPDFALTAVLQGAKSNAVTDVVNPFLRDDFNFFEGGAGLAMRYDLDIPLKEARIDAMEAEWMKAETELVLAKRAIELEVMMDAERASEYLDKLRANKRAMDFAKKWAASVEASRDVGVMDVKDTRDALIAYARSQAAWLGARYRYGVAYYKLHFSTTGGM